MLDVYFIIRFNSCALATAFVYLQLVGVDTCMSYTKEPILC